MTLRRVGFVLLLFGLWLLLSQRWNPAHLAIGFAAAVAVVALGTRRKDPAATRTRVVSAALYVPWLLVRILLSGLHVSYLILHPRLPIRSKLFRYPHKLPYDTGTVLLSNSITLTPGTIAVEADESEVLVHALDASTGGDVTSGRLERRIRAVIRTQEDRRQ